MNPTQQPAWKALAEAAKNTPKLRELVEDPQRNSLLKFELAGCLFDFTKQRINQNVLQQLIELAHASELEKLRDDMFAGETINLSEQRAVLHAALRQGANPNQQISSDIANTQAAMHNLANKITNGQWRGYTNLPITDIVHIGIGGSHLGPELVVDALHEFHTRLKKL